ncbi:MAG: type IV pilus biogenesis/stability protein PilW [Pseudomonadota bacterium]
MNVYRLLSMVFRAACLCSAGLLLACVANNAGNAGDTGTGSGAASEKSAPATEMTTTEDEEERRSKAVATRVQAGVEALKARDPERARRHISRALELDSSSAEAHNAMGLLYRYEGDDKREEEHYRKALRADGKFSQARNNYATLLYKQGRYRDAIEQLEKAADDTSYPQRALAFLNLGRCYVRVEEYDKASAALQRSLRLDSTQAEAPLELADVLLIQKKYADARAYFSVYMSRARHTARSLWTGIRLESAMGDTDKVVSYEFQMEKMFKGTPEYAAWQAWKAGAPAADTGTRKKKH